MHGTALGRPWIALLQPLVNRARRCVRRGSIFTAPRWPLYRFAVHEILSFPCCLERGAAGARSSKGNAIYRGHSIKIRNDLAKSSHHPDPRKSLLHRRVLAFSTLSLFPTNLRQTRKIDQRFLRRCPARATSLPRGERQFKLSCTSGQCESPKLPLRTGRSPESLPSRAARPYPKDVLPPTVAILSDLGLFGDFSLNIEQRPFKCVGRFTTFSITPN